MDNKSKQTLPINLFKLPDNLRGRSIKEKVIPTVCNLENMLNKIVAVNGDFSQLEKWEQKSYKAYNIEEIKKNIISTPPYVWKGIMREHILTKNPTDLGANVIDIYLVAYVAETHGAGRDEFFKYMMNSGITNETTSAQAIWQVGVGDGVYLGILDNEGQVGDWDFIFKWLSDNNK